MPNVNEMVEQYWPDHAPHTEKYGPHSVDEQTGVLCGCGELLGWPIEDEPADYDEPEPTPFALPRPESARGQAAYDKAAAAVAVARAKATGRTDDYAAEPEVRQGAFGSYPEVGGAGVPSEPVAAPEEPLDAEVVDEIPMVVHADGMMGDQTAEEWRAAQVAAGHGPSPEALADLGLAADGPVADEAQTYEVGDTVTVGGIEFTKKAEHPSIFTKPGFCVPNEAGWTPSEPVEWSFGDPDTDPNGSKPDDDYEPSEETKAHAVTLAEQSAEEPALDGSPASLEVEQETGLTPGSGTPIMPTDPDSMDPVGSYLPPIDPTQVYTPQDIEIAIVEILRRLGNGEAFLREQIARLHQADYAYTLRYHSAIRASPARAADQRKADAIIACKNELYEQSEAEMLVRALRDTMHNLRAQLMGFQSVAKSISASVNAPSFRP